MKTNKSKNISDPLQITNGSNAEPTHDEIALRAHSIWEAEGRPQDHGFEHLPQAESQLRQSRAGTGQIWCRGAGVARPNALLVTMDGKDVLDRAMLLLLLLRAATARAPGDSNHEKARADD